MSHEPERITRVLSALGEERGFAYDQDMGLMTEHNGSFQSGVAYAPFVVEVHIRSANTDGADFNEYFICGHLGLIYFIEPKVACLVEGSCFHAIRLAHPEINGQRCRTFRV